MTLCNPVTRGQCLQVIASTYKSCTWGLPVRNKSLTMQRQALCEALPSNAKLSVIVKALQACMYYEQQAIIEPDRSVLHSQL